MVVSAGYLLIGVALGIGAYIVGNKLDPLMFDGFAPFAGVVFAAAFFWVVLLPIAVFVAILFAIYWAVCTYITHDDIENPFR